MANPLIVEIIERGETGPQGPAGPGGSTVGYEAENRSGSTLPAGAAVAAYTAASGVVPAAAGASPKPALGLLAAATAAGSAGVVQVAGPLTLADWTAAAGTASLTAGGAYFVDPANPGKVTSTVPTATGQTVQSVGRAITTDTLLVEVSDPILL